MNEQLISIAIGDDLVIADLHEGGPEAVVLLPGWGGTRYGPQRILWQTARALAKRGFTTLRFDYRGRGDSTGDAEAATLDMMIVDTQAVLDWLREHRQITRVHLVGLCSGGNVAIGAASQRSDVGRVVCWSLLPFMEHKAQAAGRGKTRIDKARQLLRKLLQPDTWRKILRGEANVRGAARMLAKDKEGGAEERQRKTSSRDILADFASFTGNLHLLYGSRDPEAAGSQAFFTDWCRRRKIAVDVHVIAGAPHNFYTVQWTNEVVARTVEWIDG